MASGRRKRNSDRSAEPVDLKTAQTLYTGREITKRFPDETGHLKLFKGVVSGVDEQADEKGNIVPNTFIYSIRYEDGDEEDLSWEELVEVLVAPVAETPADMQKPQQPNMEAVDQGASKRRRKSNRENTQMDHDSTDADHEEAGDDMEENRDQHLLKSKPPPAKGFTYTGPRGVTVRDQGSAGHIFKIKLENFMCHENFQMEFGMHVNVVSGSNGSGKSAVMQALQCCLGAKARATGRSQSLGGFVRTGCHEAKVQVTLWNIGDDAYRPDVYGNQITVERRIKADGAGGGFKLLDFKGRKISERRDELDSMLDQLNLDATNPLTVLTQDTARNFLAGAVAEKKKFELFMEGTLLENVKDNVVGAQKVLAQIAHVLNTKKLEFKARQTELRKLDERLTQLKDIEEQREERERVLQALAWREVQQHQERLDEAIAARERLPVVLEGKEAILQEARRRLAARTAEEQELQEKLAGMQRELEQVAAKKQVLFKEQREEARNLQAMQKDETEFRRLIAEAEEEQKGLEENRQRDIAQADEVKQRKLDAVKEAAAEIEKVRTEREQVNEKVNEWRRKADDVNARMTALEQQKEDLQARLYEAEQQLRGLQETRQQLEDAARNKLAAFGGPPAVRLDEMVQRNAHNFRRMPVGPIGRYLNLRDERWAKVVEAAIGWLLNCWVVSCHDDRRKLEEMAQRAGYGGNNSFRPIVCNNMDRGLYEVAENQKPPGELLTILKVLNSNCEDEGISNVVFNTLIDKGSIERVVMVEDMDEGKRLLYDPNPALRVITNIYDRQCTQFKRFGTGKATIPANDRFDNVVRLGGNAAQQAEGLAEAIANHEEEVRRLKGELQVLYQTAQELQQERAQVDREKQKFAEMARRLGQKQAKLDSELQSQQHDAMDDGDDNSTEAQLLDLIRRKSAMQTDLQTVHGLIAAAQQRVQAKKEELEQLQDGNSRMIEEYEEGRGSERDKAKATAAAQRTVQDGQALVEKLRQDLVAAERQQLEAEANLKSATEEAEQICSLEAGREALEHLLVKAQREAEAQILKLTESHGMAQELDEQQVQAMLDELIARKLSTKELAKTLQKLENSIKGAETSAGGHREELQMQHDALKASMTKSKTELQAVDQVYLTLKRDVNDRMESYTTCFTNVVKTVDYNFNKYMAKRNHLGKVHIDEEAGKLTLSIKIHGRTNPNVKPVSDLKQLSGGERSFCTVAFLLALGEHTEGPFRCMDEFDVFMDAVNRRISTATLLEFALQHDNLQFILLTPQDLQAVEDAKQSVEKTRKEPLPDGFLKVVAMRPARANATQA